MKYETDHIVTDYSKRAKTDQSLKGINKIVKEKAPIILKQLINYRQKDVKETAISNIYSVMLICMRETCCRHHKVLRMP